MDLQYFDISISNQTPAFLPKFRDRLSFRRLYFIADIGKDDKRYNVDNTPQRRKVERWGKRPASSGTGLRQSIFKKLLFIFEEICL